MNRRSALRWIGTCLGAGGVLLPEFLWGQQPTGTVRIRKGAESQRRSNVELETPQEVKDLLRYWEQHTKGIKTLQGPFKRYIYNSTFLVEKRAEGDFWYQAPDRARLDFRPPEQIPEKNYKKRGPNGEPYTVRADNASKWACCGEALLVLDDDQKEYQQIDIPPHLQGENIANSPLPFLFGVSAAEMEKRYMLSLGSMHNLKNRNQTLQAHVVAYPKRAADAKEWSRAEVILDVGSYFRDSQGKPLFVPKAIRLMDPTGNKETVYWFDLNSTVCNKSFGGFLRKDPFDAKALTKGYKLTDHQKYEPSESSARKNNERKTRSIRSVQGTAPRVSQ